MSEEVTVEVTVPEAVPVETPEVAPVVVVVEDNPEPETTAPVEINHEQRLTRLEVALEALPSTLEEIIARTQIAQTTAEIADETAGLALQVADEAAEGEQQSPESDPAPENEHWFFK